MKSRYELIKNEIIKTAKECGRDPSDISLIAVTKQVAWEKILPFYLEEQRDFGENRVTEALHKQADAPADCRWHFIGNLQKNKVRKIVGNFVLVHSIDSYELAEKFSEVSQEMGSITPILLQANTSGELSKNGLNPEEWKSYFEKILKLKGIIVNGLMTMAPFTENEAFIRGCFQRLRILRDELNIMGNGKIFLSHLSMGMSHDFKIAIEEGSTLLRIGSALFED